jgi:hypothetical protein
MPLGVKNKNNNKVHVAALFKNKNKNKVHVAASACFIPKARGCKEQNFNQWEA